MKVLGQDLVFLISAHPCGMYRRWECYFGWSTC